MNWRQWMDNKKCVFLVEGECEEKLLGALREKPALILPGKVIKYNVIQKELKTSQLMTFSPGSRVVLVFDTDVEETAQLKKNIELLKKQCARVEVLTVAQVLNFEDEIERSTDVVCAQEITKSKSLSDFKRAVSKMKAVEFRRTLTRHKLDLSKLWMKQPPSAFHFVTQDAERIKAAQKF
jgi:hypothetical protein